MKLITSLSLERLDEHPNPLWGDHVERGIRLHLKRIVVLVSTRDDTNASVLAYGIDPDRVDPTVDVPVFAKVVPTANLGAFLEIVVDGKKPGPDSPQGPLAGSVDVSTQQPPPTGPTLTVLFACASALRMDEMFAQVDDTNSAAVPASLRLRSMPLESS